MTSLFVATVYFVRNTDRIDFVCARTAPPRGDGVGKEQGRRDDLNRTFL